MFSIHIYGDSISRGYGLGQWSDTLDRGDALWPVRSIWSTLGCIMAENHLPVAAKYWNNINNIESPTNFDAHISDMVSMGQIKDGDIVVFEEAGTHFSNPDLWEERWLAHRTSLVTRVRVTLLMMTMFDYPPAATTMQHDLVFGPRTMNQALAAAATATLPVSTSGFGDAPSKAVIDGRGGATERGATVLIDMNTIMDRAQAGLIASDQVYMMHGDGIHPRTLGEIVMLGQILRYSGLRPQISATEKVSDLCAANRLRIAAVLNGENNTYWTPARCAQVVDFYIRQATHGV